MNNHSSAAKMRPAYREEFGLQWLYNQFDEQAGLMLFAEEALFKLRFLVECGEILPSTYTKATAPRALVEHWLDHDKVQMRHRGRVIDQQMSGAPVGAEFGDYISLSQTIDGQTIILCDDLVRKIQKEGMTVPSFLCKPQDASGQPHSSKVTPQSSTRTDTSSAKIEWVTKAKILGTEYVAAWRAAGYTPTVEDAALYVEGVFSTEGTFNTRKEAIDRETIKREALRGITGRKAGERISAKKIPSGKRHELP